MTEDQAERVLEAMLSALMLPWQDNGNANADSIRDGCITVVAEVLGKSFAEVQAMIEQRIDDLQ